jgi:hypothetical protein
LFIEGELMITKKIGIGLFFTGVFFLLVHTTIPFLWGLIGVPSAYPLVSSEGILALLPAFTPPIGGLLMVLGGILYGKLMRR